MILGYVSTEFNFNMFSALSFLIFQSTTFYHLFGMVGFGVILWYVSCLYLYLKFKEVYIKIRLANKSNQYHLSSLQILLAIKEHNFVEKMTKDFNQFYRILIFIIYYIGTPCMLSLLYIVHHRDTNLYIRIIMALMTATAVLPILMTNYMCTWINNASYKPTALLFSYLCRTKIRIPLSHRLKIMSFIEHLSEREIGFYCYDLFPMNNFEFYQYLCMSGVNYFLIMSLF